MKERIVIPKEHIEYEQISGAGFDTIRFHLGTDKIEKVPETFEELKELCKKTEHYAVNILKGGLLDKEYIFIFGLSFRDNGDIEDIENNNVAENRTPQQMWNIIKSLVGEE